MLTDKSCSVVDEQAADWFSRRQGENFTTADEQAFQLWLAQDPLHVQAYADMQLLWDDCMNIPRPVLDDVEPVETLKVFKARPASAKRIAMACAASLMLALGLVSGYLWNTSAAYQLVVSARAGELQTVQLTDGSSAVLNMGTSLEVRYARDYREALLEAGEAFFSVAADPDRPFVVRVGPGEIKVVGTRFNVRHAEHGVAVSVEQGAVLYDPGVAGVQPIVLQHGDLGHMDYRTGQLVKTQLELNDIGSWRSGWQVFQEQPLDDLAHDLSRYLGGPVRLASPALGELKVSGSLNIYRPDQFLHALPLLLPVQIVVAEDGGFVLESLR